MQPCATSAAGTSADFRHYLLEHPVVGKLCNRLLWAEFGNEDKPTRSFRPLGDGSLVSVDNVKIILDSAATVRLVHAAALSEDEVSAWQRHLDDAKLTLLFPQLERPAQPTV